MTSKDFLTLQVHHTKKKYKPYLRDSLSIRRSHNELVSKEIRKQSSLEKEKTWFLHFQLYHLIVYIGLRLF